jgi:SpoU rRNA methylase family enzyme
MIKKYFFSAAFLLATTTMAPAQTNLRTQFNQAMALFNEMVMNKEIGEAIDMIQPDVTLNDAKKS